MSTMQQARGISGPWRAANIVGIDYGQRTEEMSVAE
jgi:hypothetical protein